MSELKLRAVLENMQNIPGDHAQAAKFADDKPKLTNEEKRSLMAKVGAFNEYASAFSTAESIVKTANELAEIAKLGKTYAMNESGDMLHQDNIIRDFKNLDKVVAEFTKRAKACYGEIQNLRVLYEDAGNIVERYWEVKDINPTSGLSADKLPPTEAPMEEIIPSATTAAPMKLSEIGVDWR